MKWPQQCFNCQKFEHHARTWRSTSRPTNIVQEDTTPTNARTTNNGHSNVHIVDRSTPPQLASAQKEWTPRKNKDCMSVTTNHTQTGQQDTSCYTTGKRMGHIDRTVQTSNSNNHTRSHRATNGNKYKPIKPNSKEINSKNSTEQKVGKGKGHPNYFTCVNGMELLLITTLIRTNHVNKWNTQSSYPHQAVILECTRSNYKDFCNQDRCRTR